MLYLAPECRSAFDSVLTSRYAAAALTSHQPRWKTMVAASTNDATRRMIGLQLLVLGKGERTCRCDTKNASRWALSP
jgi:hypothetical protein